MSDNDISVSGFIPANSDNTTSHFTEIETVQAKGFNIIAKAKRYGRWWILKGLNEPHRTESAYQTLLKKEFDILIMMQHPCIATATGFETVNGLGPCIVMEWIDGCTLKEWLTTRHTLKERLRITAQVMDALEYIHAKQTAHRDLKPSNIMITRNGQHVKLIDFGLSDTDDYAVYKQPAGTKGYISPEQEVCRETDIRNDIYSLGCVLDDMKLGLAYNGIIRRCKSKADRRYQNIEDVRRAFARCANIKRNAAILLVFIIAIPTLTAINSTLSGTKQTNNQTTKHIKTAETKTTNNHDTIYYIPSQKVVQDNKEKQKQAEIDKFIVKGERLMTQTVEKSGWRNDMPYEAYEKTYYSTSNELYSVYNNYIKQLDGLSRSEREIVREALAAHYSKLMKPLFTKIQELRKSETAEKDEPEAL